MARAGAEHARTIGVDVDATLAELARIVDVPLDADDEPFEGPVPGNATDPDTLIRACWPLAVLTEGYRGGPDALRRRPEITSLLRSRRISADELMSLTPPEAGYQLATLMDSFDVLIERLHQNPGLWCVGPKFLGSVWIPADGDLVAGGMLVDLKTSARPELPLTDLYQLVSYALLDLDNKHRIGAVAYYSARFLHLGGWHLQPLLSKMAGRPMTVDWAQGEFGEMVLKATPGGHERYRESARALSRTVRVYL